MMLVHHIGFRIGDSFQLSVVVKLQIIIFTFENKTKVAVDKILHLRPQLIEPRIQTLLEDNNLDLWNLN